MLDGKRFLPETGIPILKMARRIVVLAVELPEPFFVPTIIEKSLITLSIMLLVFYVTASSVFCDEAISHLIRTLRGFGISMLPHLNPRNDMTITVYDTKGRYV